MAQYEASTEELKQLQSNVSPTTQAVIQSIIDSGSPTQAITDQDASGTVASQNLVLTNVEANDLNSDAQNFVAADGTSGTANLNNQGPVNAAVENVNQLLLNVNNNADNSISLTVSNVSVDTGNGNDLFNFSGRITGQFNTGDGNDLFNLDSVAQESAEISVDAGDGFDLMTLFGASIKHTFSFTAGKFHMSSADVTMEGVDVVATDANEDGKITEGTDHITVLATTAEDSLIAKLYKVALGREAIDGEDGWGGSTLGGLNWWMNEYEKANDINDTAQLVRAFLNCDEFHQKYDGMDDTAYVNALFTNLGISDVKAAQSYIDQLAAGTLDRAEVAWHIADSSEAVQLLGNDGLQYVIDGFTDEA